MALERKVLELYAGVGGMHFALKEYLTERRTNCASLETEPVTFSTIAVDINETAKVVYDANFPESPVRQTDVRTLSEDSFENLWLLMMSPPCQPFSRNGNVRDVRDFRCESFLFVIERLNCSKNPPEHIIMENVKGFETSEARRRFVGVLRNRGYAFKEFLLSPITFGIPNSRLRYYLTAVRLPPGKEHPATKNDNEELPNDSLFVGLDCLRSKSSKTLAEYLRIPDPEDHDTLRVPLSTLDRYLIALDIKHPESSTTNCFTSNYGRYLKGTGSIFCPWPHETFGDMVETYQRCSNLEDSLREGHLACMQLRFFSPCEISNLMGFPETFVIPSKLTRKQAWRLIGNSLNVSVVSKLLRVMFDAPDNNMRFVLKL